MSALRIDGTTPSRAYPVHVGEGLTDALGDVLDADGASDRRFVVSSPTVWRAHGRAIERAVPGDGRAIKEKGTKRTVRIKLVECLAIDVNRIGLRRQGLRHGLGQNELQPIKCGESFGRGRVFDHLTDSRGSEANKHGIVDKVFFQDRASVDDPPAEGVDLCFGISAPPGEFVPVSSRPVFQLKPYFDVIVKRKSVFKFSAVVGGEAIFRSPRPQFGK